MKQGRLGVKITVAGQDCSDTLVREITAAAASLSDAELERLLAGERDLLRLNEAEKTDDYLDQLVALVRSYLAVWRYEDLRLLPEQVSASALPNSEAIVARAVLASQAELMWKGDEAAYKLVREMALTLGAASARLRHLHALRSNF